VVDRVVVITPTTHLRKQWAKAAHRVGIELDPRWENDSGPEARDFHGVVITYQQLASNPDVHRYHCGRTRTYVIFDEPHHGGDGRKWGDSMRRAFDNAPFKLLLSGTPFRSDNNPIPFVRYEDNRSCADFTFGYKEALRAGNICRDIYFPSYEGKMSWVSRGTLKEARFADEASEREAAERLRTAISIANEWPERVIREANPTTRSTLD
jgi:superfamily II DNA or RNA helicase